ncbi:phosphatidic acid phosphatase (PAP2) family protein [Actinidia rufa]|uniref:Phosphatidic acid phosphatase (PAP2) family protein n=1 Tax=Actinidia rufa TaxID=165716 RepID=A0A7J0E3A5_9ERIC|nr:phosphatidic acid phosphatase (PAP2) family protein [Actinidia rufa]
MMPPCCLLGFTVVCLLVGLVSLGRIYLGMHSLVDIIGGLAFGMAVLAFWLRVHDYIDEFVVSGENVASFWAILSFLLLFAYPTPEVPTPSFEYHTAFNGVALGIVTGIQQAYHQFHHNAPRIFTPQLTIPTFCGKNAGGYPNDTPREVLLQGSHEMEPSYNGKRLGDPNKINQLCPSSICFNNRFLQYAGLAWSVVDLVPSLFCHLNLGC